MEQSEFDEILAVARQAGHILKTVFEDLAEEELDLESAIRHYPILAIGLAASVGAGVGWWTARRQQRALPPPPPPAAEAQIAETPKPPSYLEQLMPTVEKVWKAVPDSVTDEAATRARTWMDTVLEPKLRQGMDNLSANMGESKWGAMLKQAMQRMDPGDDVQLDDPGEP